MNLSNLLDLAPHLNYLTEELNKGNNHASEIAVSGIQIEFNSLNDVRELIHAIGCTMNKLSLVMDDLKQYIAEREYELSECQKTKEEGE